jgi:hypothetical protein
MGEFSRFVILKEYRGSGRGIFEDTIPTFTWTESANPRKASVTIVGVAEEIRTGDV